MKTIGLIGGMSWESTLEYYRLINEEVHTRLGGFHSARLLMHSVDFADIETMQQAGNWRAAGQLLAESAHLLEQAGADAIVLCTNTMHLCADDICQAVSIPFLHIADATGDAILSAGFKRMGLLGTRFTMERDFYSGRLSQNFGLDVLIPSERDRGFIHHVIFEELVHGIFREESRQGYQRIITELKNMGVQGVILGCTEIGMLVKASACGLPLFDTTQLHAAAAVDFMLKIG